MTTWQYPSSSGGGTYTVTHADNGMLGCDCKGWTIKRPGKPRQCKHITDVLTQHGWTPVIRGDYVFVTGASAPAPTAPVPTPAVPVAPKAFEPMKAIAMTGQFSHLMAGKQIIPANFDATFGDGAWAMEEKLDGHRCQIVKRGESVTTTLQSTPLPPQIVEAIRQLPVDLHLDGELCVPGGVSTDVPNLTLQSKLVYIVFDLIEVSGSSTTHLRYADRRKMLDLLGEHFGSPALRVVTRYEPTFAHVKTIWARGGEGAILKRLDSKYHQGRRGPDWIKVKGLQQHTVTVTGFEEGSLGPTAVTIFRFDDGTEGRCKTLNNEELAATSANPAAFIGRRLVVQMQQRTRSKSKARHPMWDHWAGEGE